jgi:O-acetyl-ADP-ribose deacetylase (regulator of RNase III)
MKNQTKNGTFVTVDGNAIDEFMNSTGTAIFMHGANCQSMMGAGIALEVRNRLPELYYLDKYDIRTPHQKLGSFSAVLLGVGPDQKSKIGVNLYTQFNGGANFDMIAMINSLNSFILSLHPSLGASSDITIYIPKIGSGIGGGNWQKIEKELQNMLREFNLVVVNYKPKEGAPLKKIIE